MVQRERAARRDDGDAEGGTLCTTGMSLGGGKDSVAGGGDEGSAVRAWSLRSLACATATGDAARRFGNVTFSLRLSGGTLLGGGGGKLPRATGISSVGGASPPRTTTA